MSTQTLETQVARKIKVKWSKNKECFEPYKTPSRTVTTISEGDLLLFEMKKEDGTKVYLEELVIKKEGGKVITIREHNTTTWANSYSAIIRHSYPCIETPNGFSLKSDPLYKLLDTNTEEYQGLKEILKGVRR